MTSKREDREALIEARGRLKALLDEGERCLCVTPGGEAFADLRVLLDSFEQAHTPTDDEREALLNALDPSSRRIAWASRTADRVFAAGFRRPVQGEPLPDYFAPKPMPQGWVQGEPAERERESLPVASPDIWGWDWCLVCGSRAVTDRGMTVMVSSDVGPFVARVAWCDQTQECRDDLRQMSFLLTETDAEAVDAALRAAAAVTEQGGENR